MGLPVESAGQTTRVRVTPGQSASFQSDSCDELRAKIESYLLAWGFPNRASTREAAAGILGAVQPPLADRADFDPARTAIEECDKFLAAHFRKSSTDFPATDGDALAVMGRVALLIGDAPGKLPEALPGSISFSEWMAVFELTKQPQRPIEPLPTKTMQTSLSRLPSFGLIAGWSAVVLVLVLVFIFTH
jgi:hypothetical protein